MVEETDWLPVEEQVAPVMLPEPLEEELLLDDEEVDDELLEDELLEDELDELLDDELEVEPAYEHQAEVTPEKAPPKLELEQATLPVKVP